MESFACEAHRLGSPRLCALCSSLFGVDECEQPEAGGVPLRAVRGLGSLNGLHSDPPRPVEIAGEEQRLG